MAAGLVVRAVGACAFCPPVATTAAAPRRAGAASRGCRRGACLQRRARLRVGEPAYWERRYSTRDKGDSQDDVDDRGAGWLCQYAGPLQQTLVSVTREDRTRRILNLGCGVDRLSEDVYADGFRNLVSVDIAPAAVKEMQSRTADTMPDAKWMVDDALGMDLASQSVDVVVDKGTLDGILSLAAPFTSAMQVLGEVQRVLKVEGSYLLAISSAGNSEAQLLPLLALPHLSMNVQRTPDLGGYFLFVCTKLEEMAPDMYSAKFNEAKVWAEDRDREHQAREWAEVEVIGQ